MGGEKTMTTTLAAAPPSDKVERGSMEPSESTPKESGVITDRVLARVNYSRPSVGLATSDSWRPNFTEGWITVTEAQNIPHNEIDYVQW